MLQMPKIRLEVEGMKYQVVHFIGQHHDEIEAEIERVVERTMATYPFESEILALAKDAISKSIKDSITEYFQWGEGKEFIKKVVLESIKKLVEEE